MEEEEGCTRQARKIEQSERPEIAWPGNINFEGDSRRCRKSPENFECPRNRGASSSRVYKGALTWGYHHHLLRCLLAVLVFLSSSLSCFSASLSIVVFSIVRDNDTHTLLLGNNINGFVYPETIGGSAKGTSWRPLTRRSKKWPRTASPGIVRKMWIRTN